MTARGLDDSFHFGMGLAVETAGIVTRVLCIPYFVSTEYSRVDILVCTAQLSTLFSVIQEVKSISKSSAYLTLSPEPKVYPMHTLLIWRWNARTVTAHEFFEKRFVSLVSGTAE